MNKIKSLLALLAALVCGGAWAATPVAVWENLNISGDALTQNGMTLNLNLGTGENNNKVVGTAVKIGDKPIVVTLGTDGFSDYLGTVIIKYSGVSSNPSQAVALATFDGSNGQDYTGVNVQTTGAVKGVLNGVDWNDSTYNKSSGNIPTDGLSHQLALAVEMTSSAVKSRGTHAYIDGATVYDVSGLVGKNTTIQKFNIGGGSLSGASGKLPVFSGLVVEKIAVFHDVLTKSEAIHYRFPSEDPGIQPMSFNTQLTGSYVKTDWQVADIDTLASYTFSGVMGGTSVSNPKHRNATAYFVKKHTDTNPQTVAFEMQIKDGELKSTGVIMKIENGVVWIKGGGGAYLTGGTLGTQLLTDDCTAKGSNATNTGTLTGYAVKSVVAHAPDVTKEAASGDLTWSTMFDTVPADGANVKIALAANTTVNLDRDVKIRRLSITGTGSTLTFTGKKLYCNTVFGGSVTFNNEAVYFDANGNASGDDMFFCPATVAGTARIHKIGVGRIDFDGINNSATIDIDEGTAVIPQGTSCTVNVASKGVYGSTGDHSSATVNFNGGVLRNLRGADTAHNLIQFANLNFNGDGTIDTMGNKFESIASNYGKHNINLNGNKITKLGSAEFPFWYPEFVGGGAIDVQDGTLTIYDLNMSAGQTLDISVASNKTLWFSNNKSTDAVNGELNLVNAGTVNVGESVGMTFHDFKNTGTIGKPTSQGTYKVTGLYDIIGANSRPDTLTVTATTTYRFASDSTELTLADTTLSLEGITDNTVEYAPCYVGDTQKVVKLVYDTTNKKVSYAVVREDAGDVYYSHTSGGGAYTFVLSDGTTTALIDGDVVIVDGSSGHFTANMWGGGLNLTPLAGNKVKVNREMDLGGTGGIPAGQVIEINYGEVVNSQNKGVYLYNGIGDGATVSGVGALYFGYGPNETKVASHLGNNVTISCTTGFADSGREAIIEGAVTITGTIVTAEESSFKLAESGSLKVREGTNVGTITSNVPGKYVLKATADGYTTYFLGDSAPVAEVGGTDYATLVDAITAAGEGQEIKILADSSETLALTKHVTFNVPSGEIRTLSGVISGEYSVTKKGAGTLILSGSNTYTGGTEIVGGTIQARTGTANTTAVTSFGVGDVDVRNGATLDIYGRYLANQIYIAGDGVGNNGALINTGTDLGKNLDDGNNWKISLRANSSWGGNYFTHFGSNAVVALGGYTFTKKGSNNFPLNNTSGITNGKIVVEAGQFQNNNNANDLSTVELEIKSGATLNMNGGTSLTVKSFKCEGSITGTNVKLVIAQNGYLYESSASIPKLELLEGATVVAAANKKITIGTSLTATAVKVDASAKTEASDGTPLFTMPSEADAIALAAKISLVNDTQHAVVAKGADVCLVPAAISGESAFKAAVATAGDVTLGESLTLTKTIEVADGVTLNLGGNTISSGVLNLASGTVTFHVEQGKTATVSSQITGTGNIVKTGGGTLILGANNNTQSGKLQIDSGIVQIKEANSNATATGYNVVLNGGKLVCETVSDAHGKLIKSVVLEKNGTIEAHATLGHGNGLIGVGVNGTETSVELNGHTLTLTGKSSSNRVYFDKTSISSTGSAGTINVTKGKLFFHCSVPTLPENTTINIGTEASIEIAKELTNHNLLIPNLEYNGALPADTDIPNLTVTRKLSGSGTMKKLTLSDGATLAVVSGSAPTVNGTLTLGATLKVNVKGVSGGEATVWTVPAGTNFASTTISSVNDQGAADNTWILKASGDALKAYRNAEVGGNTPTTAIGDDFSNIVMASVDKITVADIAEKYEVAARFTNTDVGASDKTAIVVGSAVVDGNYNIQFQIVDGYLKWCNVQLKVELDNATGLYLVKVKRVDSAYHNETADVEKVGKKQTGGTSHNYYVCSFSLTPGALQPKLSYDSRIVNGVLVGFDSSITQPWFNTWNGERFVATTKTIGAEPGSEVATVANGKTPHANDFNFSSVPGVTMAMYANALNVQPSGNKPFLSFGGNGTGAIFINLNAEGKPELIVNTNPVTKITCDSTSFADNGFHLYVATIDAKRVIRFYVDSELIGTCYKSDFTPGTALQVGKIFSNHNDYGRADNLAVANLIGFPRSLTEVQVAELAKRYPFVPMAKAEGVDTPIRGVDASKLVEEYNAAKPGSAAAATSINSEGVNGLPLWKSDILGLNPTDENSRTVVISGAQTTDAGSMKLLTGIKPNPEIMTVTLKSGATAACDDTDVTPMSDDGSFTVTLPIGDDKVKYYKLTYEFPSAE